MATFDRLFTELFKQKCKKTHLVILIQLLITLIATIFVYFENNDTVKAISKNQTSFLITLFLFFVSFSIIFLLIYLIITCVQNEQINHSQTWRLVPMSDATIYLDNTLSSFVNFIYLAVLQIIGSLILFGLSYLCDTQIKSDWEIKLGNQANAIISDLLGIVVIMVLLGLLVYLVVSFLNFSSQAIIDFLPIVSSKLVVTFVRLILIIGIMWLLIKTYFVIKPAVETPLSYLLDGKELSVWPLVGLFAGLDIIFVVVNMFLISKFFEAKQNK